MDRAVLCLDLANGQVKALAKAPGGDFKPVSFPSFVAIPSAVNSDCVQFKEGDAIKTYLVGERAAAIPGAATGATETGKVQNAKAILINTLRLAFGEDCGSVHCDVIFTTPSNKAYGAEVAELLTGLTVVTVPADSEVIGSKAKQFTVVVHRARPRLEGHDACSLLKLKADSWLIDQGNRTTIATLVAPTGRILKRRYFAAGVAGLASRIVETESLAALIPEPTIQKVIDELFAGRWEAKAMAEAIAADIETATAEARLFVASVDAPRFLIGGGATVPGLADAFGAKAVKNPQWLNIEALAAVHSQILEA